MKPLLKLIHPKRRKNIYMCTLVLLTTIGFNIMRGMRETVVFQFGKNGALYTPFIRILGVLPISALLFIIYLSVKKKYNTLAAYYAITIPFLMYFLGYSLFSKQIMIDTSQHPEWILLIRDFYRPLEFVGVIIQHWDKTLYYVFCEAWGSFTWSFCSGKWPMNTTPKRMLPNTIPYSQCLAVSASSYHPLSSARWANIPISLQLTTRYTIYRHL